MLDYPKERKYSVVSFCSGTIAGLIVATSVSGFVPVWGALLLGIIGGAVCKYSTNSELSYDSTTILFLPRKQDTDGHQTVMILQLNTTSALTTRLIFLHFTVWAA